jgi:hypothetical protein
LAIQIPHPINSSLQPVLLRCNGADFGNFILKQVAQKVGIMHRQI